MTKIVTPYTSAFLTGPKVQNILLQNQCSDDYSGTWEFSTTRSRSKMCSRPGHRQPIIRPDVLGGRSGSVSRAPCRLPTPNETISPGSPPGVRHGQSAIDGADLAGAPELLGALQPALEEHAQARRATGWPKLLRPPSGLMGSSPCRPKVPASTSFQAVLLARESQIFHEHQLGGRKTVMHFGHGELPRGSVMPAWR